MADEVDKMGFGPPSEYGRWRLNGDKEWESGSFVSHWEIDRSGNWARPLSHSLSPIMQRKDGSTYSIYTNPGGRRGPCFVATSAFGNQDHPAIDSLRRYRDEVLSKNPIGSAFVSAYYGGLGQAGARVLDSVPALKPAVRTGIEKLVARVIEPSLQARQNRDRPYK